MYIVDILYYIRFESVYKIGNLLLLEYEYSHFPKKKNAGFFNFFQI